MYVIDRYMYIYSTCTVHVRTCESITASYKHFYIATIIIVSGKTDICEKFSQRENTYLCVIAVSMQRSHQGGIHICLTQAAFTISDHKPIITTFYYEARAGLHVVC